jgi:hypothetical protein
MDHKNIMSELNDKQIEELTQYSTKCTEENLNNIKSRFHAKIYVKKAPLAKKKMFIAASVAAVILVFSGFVYTDIIDLSKIYEMAFGKNSEYIGQYDEIINGGNNDNGIQLRLLSTIKDEDKMLVFFSLTDTTEDRLSATMDLHDSWTLDQGYGGNCKLISYDNDTKTANFLITSVGDTTDDNATLTIKSFLKSLEFKESLQENDININKLISSNVTETVPFSQYKEDGYGMGISSNSKYNDDDVLDNLLLLKEDQFTVQFSNIDWAIVSNVGFIDDELHIQTKLINNTFSNIMSMYFVDENNNTIFTNELSVNHKKTNNNINTKHDEFIFENINNVSQLNNLRLVIDVAEYGDYFTGDWFATFKVPEPAIKIIIPIHDTLTLADEVIEVDTVTLSPLSLIIQYETKILTSSGENTDKAFVTYNDGTIVNFQFVSRGTNDEICTYTFSDPIIEIEKVTSININGKEFSIYRQ